MLPLCRHTQTAFVGSVPVDVNEQSLSCIICICDALSTPIAYATKAKIIKTIHGTIKAACGATPNAPVLKTVLGSIDLVQILVTIVHNGPNLNVDDTKCSDRQELVYHISELLVDLHMLQHDYNKNNGGDLEGINIISVIFYVIISELGNDFSIEPLLNVLLLAQSIFSTNTLVYANFQDTKFLEALCVILNKTDPSFEIQTSSLLIIILNMVTIYHGNDNTAVKWFYSSCSGQLVNWIKGANICSNIRLLSISLVTFYINNVTDYTELITEHIATDLVSALLNILVARKINSPLKISSIYLINKLVQEYEDICMNNFGGTSMGNWLLEAIRTNSNEIGMHILETIAIQKEKIKKRWSLGSSHAFNTMLKAAVDVVLKPERSNDLHTRYVAALVDAFNEILESKSRDHTLVFVVIECLLKLLPFKWYNEEITAHELEIALLDSDTVYTRGYHDIRTVAFYDMLYFLLKTLETMIQGKFTNTSSIVLDTTLKLSLKLSSLDTVLSICNVAINVYFFISSHQVILGTQRYVARLLACNMKILVLTRGMINYIQASNIQPEPSKPQLGITNLSLLNVLVAVNHTRLIKGYFSLLSIQWVLNFLLDTCGWFSSETLLDHLEDQCNKNVKSYAKTFRKQLESLSLIDVIFQQDKSIYLDDASKINLSKVLEFIIRHILLGKNTVVENTILTTSSIIQELFFTTKSGMIDTELNQDTFATAIALVALPAHANSNCYKLQQIRRFLEKHLHFLKPTQGKCAAPSDENTLDCMEDPKLLLFCTAIYSDMTLQRFILLKMHSFKQCDLLIWQWFCKSQYSEEFSNILVAFLNTIIQMEVLGDHKYHMASLLYQFLALEMQLSKKDNYRCIMNSLAPVSTSKVKLLTDYAATEIKRIEHSQYDMIERLNVAQAFAQRHTWILKKLNLGNENKSEYGDLITASLDMLCNLLFQLFYSKISQWSVKMDSYQQKMPLYINDIVDAIFHFIDYFSEDNFMVISYPLQVFCCIVQIEEEMFALDKNPLDHILLLYTRILMIAIENNYRGVINKLVDESFWDFIKNGLVEHKNETFRPSTYMLTFAMARYAMRHNSTSKAERMLNFQHLNGDANTVEYVIWKSAIHLDNSINCAAALTVLIQILISEDVEITMGEFRQMILAMVNFAIKMHQESQLLEFDLACCLLALMLISGSGADNFDKVVNSYILAVMVEDVFLIMFNDAQSLEITGLVTTSSILLFTLILKLCPLWLNISEQMRENILKVIKIIGLDASIKIDSWALLDLENLMECNNQEDVPTHSKAKAISDNTSAGKDGKVKQKTDKGATINLDENGKENDKQQSNATAIKNFEHIRSAAMQMILDDAVEYIMIQIKSKTFAPNQN